MERSRLHWQRPTYMARLTLSTMVPITDVRPRAGSGSSCGCWRISEAFRSKNGQIRLGLHPLTIPLMMLRSTIDAGFQYIQECWVVPASGVKQLHWITRTLKDPASPLHENGPYKWSERLIEKSFSWLREEGARAKIVTDCPYTVKSMAPWLVDNIMAELVPHMTIRSLALVGKAGCGKTPVMETLLCAFSRFWKRRMNIDGPGWYRTANDLDFFRGEVGTKDRPDGLDDPDPKLITPSRWKAFCDIGLVESMTRERWGASKWVRNQLRILACNPFDDRTEPADGRTVTHQQFMEIISALWGKDMDPESMLAVVKRCCFIVVTNEWIYYRVATENTVDVPRLKLTDETEMSKSLMTREFYATSLAWKNGDLELPECYEEDLAWEESWMNAVMSKGALDIPRLSPARDGPNAPEDGVGIVPPTPSQDDAVPPLSIRADSQGNYGPIPFARTGTGSTLRSKFCIPKSGPSSASRSSGLKMGTGSHSASAASSGASASCAMPSVPSTPSDAHALSMQ